MKLTDENLKALKLDASASPDEINKRIAELVALGEKTEDKSENKSEEKADASEADPKAFLRGMMSQLREVVAEELREEMKKEARAKKVVELVALAESQGKVIEDNRKSVQALAEADPDAFEKVIPSLKVIAPVKRVMTGAPKMALPSGTAAQPAEAQNLTEAYKLMRTQPNLSIHEAIAKVEAGESN